MKCPICNQRYDYKLRNGQSDNVTGIVCRSVDGSVYIHNEVIDNLDYYSILDSRVHR